MELTQEYFEQYLQSQFNDFEKKMDQKLDQKLDEKLDQKLGEQTKELKAYVHESFEVQQVYIDERFEELAGSLRLYRLRKSLKHNL